MSNKTTSAVILVAGTGSRLRPLTDDRPKALVEIGGETLLARTVRILARFGVTKLVLATGYRDDAVQSALRSAPMACVFVNNPDYLTTQNSISLALCRDALAGAAFFKLDGDVLFRAEVLERLDASPADLVVALDRSRPPDVEAMKVRLHDQRPTGRELSIAAFGKNLALGESAGETIGIERLSVKAGEILFEALTRQLIARRFELYYEDVYSELVAAGALEATAVDVGDLAWTEIDTLEDLGRARGLLGELD